MNEITLPQGTIRYREIGHGPPIVFVHGLLASGVLWEGVAAALAPRYRCILPDWPLGSHTTPMRADADLSPAGMAAVVAAFIAALDLRDVTLVGNDSGGAISQLVAVRHPERLGRLVLTNCDALEVFPPKGFGYLSWVARIPGAMFLVARALLHIPRLQRLPMAYGALTRRPLSDATLRQWVEPAAHDPLIRRDVGKFMRGISRRITLDAARALDRFDRPALLVWGADDPFFTVALARRLAAHIPGARVHTIADATVYAPLDQPEAVATHIARFAAETGRAAAPAA